MKSKYKQFGALAFLCMKMDLGFLCMCIDLGFLCHCSTILNMWLHSMVQGAYSGSSHFGYFTLSTKSPCFVRAFSSCGEPGPALRCSAQASHCGGFSCCRPWALARGLSSCGTQALLLCGMWNVPGPGIEPMSPALAEGFLSSVPPGKSRKDLLFDSSSR